MELSSKYAPLSEKDKLENKDKKILSDDAYAICEFIEILTKRIEHVRTSLIR